MICEQTTRSRSKFILRALGSPDPYGRQVDGVGGATSSTSKVAIITRGAEGVDVDYRFGQIAIDSALIDWSANCGNISSAVGPYAIDEGYACPPDPITVVPQYDYEQDHHCSSANGGTRLFQQDGDFVIDGVPRAGSKICLESVDPGGSVTGRLLTTGNERDQLPIPGLGAIEVSIVDAAATTVVFCRVGMPG